MSNKNYDRMKKEDSMSSEKITMKRMNPNKKIVNNDKKDMSIIDVSDISIYKYI